MDMFIFAHLVLLTLMCITYLTYRLLRKILTKFEERVFEELIREIYLSDIYRPTERGDGDFKPLNREFSMEKLFADVTARTRLNNTIDVRRSRSATNLQRTNTQNEINLLFRRHRSLL